MWFQLAKVWLTTDFKTLRRDRRAGQTAGDSHVAAVGTTFSLSPRSLLAALLQYNSTAHTFSTNLRFWVTKLIDLRRTAVPLRRLRGER